jgi:fatty-acyl-CoA synthase
VFTDDGRRVEAGSGERGMVGIGGFIPVGYYKDEVKSAQTFRVIEGQRWSIPGDFAEVNPDGSLHLLGRGSVCINTGGEKVYPDEVESVVKDHPDVLDAVVVGVPDDRWGEQVVAVVSGRPGRTPALDSIREHCRTALAGYKVPRAVCVVDEVVRSPNGKADYRWAREVATANDVH